MEMQKNITDNKRDGEDRKFINDDGQYLCVVEGARYLPPNPGVRGEVFAIDLRVVDGDGHIGEATTWLKKRPILYETSHLGGGKKFTAEQKKYKDSEAIQVAFAAVVGLPRAEAGRLADGESHAGSFQKCFGGKYDSQDDASDVIGRKVILRVSTKKNSTYKNSDLLPYIESTPKAAPKAAVAKAAPALPSKPKVPTLEMALKENGFEIHPGDANYVFNATTEECIELTEFKARFGF